MKKEAKLVYYNNMKGKYKLLLISTLKCNAYFKYFTTKYSNISRRKPSGERDLDDMVIVTGSLWCRLLATG